MRLVAITNVKYGPKGETAEAGVAFEVDTKTAKELIANGGAATPEDYETMKAAARTPEQINAQIAAENASLREENEKLRDELAKAKK